MRREVESQRDASSAEDEHRVTCLHFDWAIESIICGEGGTSAFYQLQ